MTASSAIGHVKEGYKGSRIPGVTATAGLEGSQSFGVLEPESIGERDKKGCEGENWACGEKQGGEKDSP